MFRHFVTGINYDLLIKMQAKQKSFAPVVSKKAKLQKSKVKTKGKVRQIKRIT